MLLFQNFAKFCTKPFYQGDDSGKPSARWF